MFGAANAPSRRWLAGFVALVAVAPACADSGEHGASAPPGGAVVAAAPVAMLPDEELVARFGAAVWRVETDGCGWTGSGSAFAVDAHHLVTNHHVVATDVGPELVSTAGERVDGRVIGMSVAADVAVIEVDEPLPVTVAWAPTEAIGSGERILAFGYPAPDLAFTISWGQIVDFVGPGGDSQAMLTDAPINKGNSGGPALRGDGTVVGVVTQMSVGGAADHAAIVFPTTSVQPLVSGYIGAPQAVVSDCGYGPEYVPPIPEAFTVPAVLPAPPATTPTTPLPRPTVPSGSQPTSPLATAAPTTVAAQCPDGDVTIEAVGVSVSPGEGSTTWDVAIDGTITNHADGGALASYVVAQVQGSDVRELYSDNPAPFAVPAGAAVPFVIAGAVISDTEPVLRRLDLSYGWSDAGQQYCPAAPVTVDNA